MSFDCDAVVPAWYGGLVGPLHSTGQGHTCGFDDGEVRFVPHDEVRVGLEIGVVAAMPADAGGLCDNVPIEVRAIDFTTLKEGGKKNANIMGVLLGHPDHVLGSLGILLYAEHHLNKQAELDSAVRSSKRKKSRGDLTPSAFETPDRRGFHTFKRGDIVEFIARGDAAPPTPGIVFPTVRTVVYGVIVCKVRTQNRKYLVLYSERKGSTKEFFFFATWAAWQRTQLPGPDVLSTRFDPDNDDHDVCVATAPVLASMAQAWAASPLTAPSIDRLHSLANEEPQEVKAYKKLVKAEVARSSKVVKQEAAKQEAAAAAKRAAAAAEKAKKLEEVRKAAAARAPAAAPAAASAAAPPASALAPSAAPAPAAPAPAAALAAGGVGRGIAGLGSETGRMCPPPLSHAAFDGGDGAAVEDPGFQYHTDVDTSSDCGMSTSSLNTADVLGILSGGRTAFRTPVGAGVAASRIGAGDVGPEPIPVFPNLSSTGANSGRLPSQRRPPMPDVSAHALPQAPVAAPHAPPPGQHAFHGQPPSPLLGQYPPHCYGAPPGHHQQQRAADGQQSWPPAQHFPHQYPQHSIAHVPFGPTAFQPSSFQQPSYEQLAAAYWAFAGQQTTSPFPQTHQQPPFMQRPGTYLPHTPLPTMPPTPSAEDSLTPPELVSKQQQLTGLLAAQALDPSCAPRASMIAELRFDIERLERKRKLR
eukprot:6212961-Pleurochrysis_carterae.AAC.1